MLPLPAWHPWGVQVGLAVAEALGLVAKGWCHAPGHLEDHSTLGGASLAAKGLVAKDWCHAPGHLEDHSTLGAGLAAKGLIRHCDCNSYVMGARTRLFEV